MPPAGGSCSNIVFTSRFPRLLPASLPFLHLRVPQPASRLTPRGAPLQTFRRSKLLPVSSREFWVPRLSTRKACDRDLLKVCHPCTLPRRHRALPPAPRDAHPPGTPLVEENSGSPRVASPLLSAAQETRAPCQLLLLIFSASSPLSPAEEEVAETAVELGLSLVDMH